MLDKVGLFGYGVHIMNFLTPNEVLAVLKIAREKSLRDFLLILLAYKHGMRASEVTSLKIDDVKDGSVTIRRLKNSRTTVQPLESHRGVPLLNEVRNLSEWMKERPADGGGEFLFPSKKGGPLTGNSFNKIFKGYALAAGIDPKKAHPHALKHSIANHLIRAGVDIGYLQIRLGHRSLSSTQKYVMLEDQEVAVKTQNALINIF